jgi:hypothetical protein
MRNCREKYQAKSGYLNKKFSRMVEILIVRRSKNFPIEIINRFLNMLINKISNLLIKKIMVTRLIHEEVM